MVSTKVTLKIPTGLHARPVGAIVKFTENFSGSVKMVYGTAEANCKSPISLLSLGVKPGSEVEIVVEGDNEADELASIVGFLEKLDH